MAEFRIVLPNQAAAQALEPYMEGILNRVTPSGYPASVRITIETSAQAVQAYPHIRAHGSERQIMRLERIIRDYSLELPIPKLESTASINDLVGLDRTVRGMLLREGFRTIQDLSNLRTDQLGTYLGAGKRKKHLIGCMHAHGFMFADEK